MMVNRTFFMEDNKDGKVKIMAFLRGFVFAPLHFNLYVHDLPI